MIKKLKLISLNVFEMIEKKNLIEKKNQIVPKLILICRILKYKIRCYKSMAISAETVLQN